MSTATADPIPETKTQYQQNNEVGLGGFNPAKNAKQSENMAGFKLNDFVFNAPVKDEKEEV